MIKAIVLTGLAAVAVAQYPQQQGAAPQGAPYSFSSSVNHAAGPAAGGPQQAYAAPQSYAPQAPPAAAGGYNPGAYQQVGAGAGAGQFGNIQQIAAQNPAFAIQVPQGQEQPVYGGAPQPAPGSYAAPQQYAAPQSYGAPQAAGGANPYGGPFSYSSSVSHSVPQAQPQAGAAPLLTRANHRGTLSAKPKADPLCLILGNRIMLFQGG